MLIDILDIIRVTWIVSIDQKTFDIINAPSRYASTLNRYDTMTDRESMYRVESSKLIIPVPMVGLPQTYTHRLRVCLTDIQQFRPSVRELGADVI